MLIELRIRDLMMFSEKEVEKETINQIRKFYEEKILSGECHTIVGYCNEKVIASATIYFYNILPSNENPKGIVGQITNVWVDIEHRNKGIATKLVRKLIDDHGKDMGTICLNSSKEAMGMYLKLGFTPSENYLVLR